LNPTLTQLAKTHRAIFVEGQDFQILGRFANKLGARNIGNRSDFAVVPVDGFNPDRIRSIKAGIEATLGGRISAAAILDRDYRSGEERDAIKAYCEAFCDLAVVHACKEIENFLLVPDAIDRAASARVADQDKRIGKTTAFSKVASEALLEFANDKKAYVASQYVFARRAFERSRGSGAHEASVTEAALLIFEEDWKNPELLLKMIPGKEALSAINQILQRRYQVSVTPTGIIDAMRIEEIPKDMSKLIQDITNFCSLH
jgi:hypothetical protein